MRVIIALCSLLALSSTLPQLAKAELDISDRAVLNSIIRKFIQNNPEVVRDSLISLAAREEAERKQAGLASVRNDRGDPVMGNPDGAITLYEFSDYNCGYCKRVFEPIQKMLRDNPDVRLVIKEFPILSQSSLVAAQAAIAAEMQGKFAEYHIGMMTYRGQITNAVVMRVAQQAGLDNTQLQKDIESPETAAIIQRTREAASALSLNGTPALVIGDTIIPGAIGLDELVGLISDERAKQG
jgi:protein-disulfide isomerase